MKTLTSKQLSFVKSYLLFFLTVSLFLCVFSDTGICALQLNATDPVDNKTYTISQENRTVTINTDGSVKSIPFAYPITDAVCFNKHLTFLATDEKSQDKHHYVFMYYNANNNDANTIVTDISVSREPVSFCADESGNIYLLDSNNKTIHIISQNGNRSINTNCTVYQLLYMGNNELLVFTDSGTACISVGSYKVISDLRVATPCIYVSSTKVADTQGTEYVYENSVFEKIVPPTEENTTTPLPSDTQYITAISDSYITITQGTTFAKLYKELGLKKADLTVCKPDGPVVDSGTLGTGMTAKFNGYTLQIIVLGDLTGEGNINSRDLKALMKHLSGESLLKGAYLEAADLYADNIVNTKDLLALSRLYE